MDHGVPRHGDLTEDPAEGRGFRAYSAGELDRLLAQAGLDGPERLAARAVAAVVPFRANDSVTEHLIDWAAAPDDPIYRLFFPQADMLPADDVRARRGPGYSPVRLASQR